MPPLWASIATGDDVRLRRRGANGRRIARTAPSAKREVRGRPVCGRQTGGPQSRNSRLFIWVVGAVMPKGANLNQVDFEMTMLALFVAA